MSAKWNGREPPEFEIPDLELPPPRPSQSGLRAVAPSQHAPRAADAGVSPALLELDEETSAPRFDLDLHGPISSAGPAAGFAESISSGLLEFELEEVRALPAVNLPLATESEARQHWPAGPSTKRARLHFDPSALSLHAAYGMAPRSPLTTPVYALRVLWRRAELRHLSRRAETALSDSAQQRDALLVQLAERVRPALEANPSFRNALTTLRDAERQLPAAASPAAPLSLGPGGQAALLEAELASAFDLEAQARARLVASAANRDAEEQALRRAEAKQQRFQIEMRAIEQRRAALGATARADDLDASMSSVVTQAEAIAPQIAILRERHRVAVSAHAADELELRAVELERNRQSRRAHQLQHRHSKQQQRQDHAATDGQQERLNALVRLGRQLLAEPAGVSIDSLIFERIRSADHAAALAAEDAERELRAIDCYDAERYRQGLRWLAILAGCVVLLFALLVMRLGPA